MSNVDRTIEKGTRVALHAACDEWMQGDKYGTVVGYGHARLFVDRATGLHETVKPLRVKLDVSGRVRRFHPDLVFTI